MYTDLISTILKHALGNVFVLFDIQLDALEIFRRVPATAKSGY